MNIQSAINAGLFVQFVALQWNSTSQTTDLKGRKVLDPAGNPVIHGASYTVIQTLYACDLATDFNRTHPLQNTFTTMGIVAANDADPNDVVIAIRGTLTVWEWLQDAKFLLIPFKSVAGAGLTEDGFTDMYYSFSLTPSACTTAFIAALSQLLPNSATVTVAGHSLGAAIATLFAIDLAANTNFPVTLYTLASPRVGDLTFSHTFNHLVPNAYRVCNRLDIVPKVPPPLMYFHVGDETELVPSAQLKFDLGCEHHLTSYFNMLGVLSGQTAKYPIQPDCVIGGPAVPRVNPSAA